VWKLTVLVSFSDFDGLMGKSISAVPGDALPRAGAAIAIVLTAMVAGVAVAVLMSRGGTSGGGGATGEAVRCDTEIETMHVAADSAVAPIVQRLADAYTGDLIANGRECIPIEVTPTSSSAVVGRLTNGWTEPVHGPTPDVWIPQSTLWMDLLRDQLDDPSILSDEPSVLARTPTVLALPRPMAEALGWPDAQVTWQDVLELADSDEGWAAHGHPEWGPFRLRLTDPRYTITGLQALLALDSAQQPDQPEQAGTTLSLFRVQRVLAGIDADAGEQLELYAQAEDFPEALSAVPLEERQLWQFNRTGSVTEDADAAPTGEPRPVPDLVAVYPTGEDQVALESDYPYLVLDAPWVSPEVLQYADEFGDYLLSDAAVEQFARAGFRTPDNHAAAPLQSSDDIQPSDVASGPPSGELPDVEAVQRLRSSWVTVPRLSSTLLLVDVSGSMAQTVPGTGQTRLQATVEAAKRSLEVIPPGSDVGLWEFSTALEGGRNDGDLRELVDLGPLNEVVGGDTRNTELVGALDGLRARNDTALNDTLLAAYETMRAGYTPGQRHTIILLTDGRNDDADSISHEELLDELQALRTPDQPIQVVSIAHGAQPDIGKLNEISELVGGRVLASPELDNLVELFIEALAQ